MAAEKASDSAMGRLMNAAGVLALRRNAAGPSKETTQLYKAAFQDVLCPCHSYEYFEGTITPLPA